MTSREPEEEAACTLKGRRQGWELEPSEEKKGDQDTGKQEVGPGKERKDLETYTFWLSLILFRRTLICK